MRLAAGVMPERVLRVSNQRRVQIWGLERDVVCAIQVDPGKAAGTSENNGKTYDFCSKGCKVKVDTHPNEFLK